MYLLFAILLVLLPATLYTLNTTNVPIITCTRPTECPSTHFCNSQQRVCVLKYSINSTCECSMQCLNGKCYENICRKSCTIDNECSLTKEYCTIQNYCLEKHCKICTRNAQCANNYCYYFYCKTDTCITALAALQNQ